MDTSEAMQDPLHNMRDKNVAKCRCSKEHRTQGPGSRLCVGRSASQYNSFGAQSTPFQREELPLAPIKEATAASCCSNGYGEASKLRCSACKCALHSLSWPCRNSSITAARAEDVTFIV